jgi:hypothetical protein
MAWRASVIKAFAETKSFLYDLSLGGALSGSDESDTTRVSL